MGLGRLRVPHNVAVALRQALGNPHIMASIPGLLVMSYVFGGELMLLGVAGAVPLTLMLAGLLSAPKVECGQRDPLTGLPFNDTALRYIRLLLRRSSRRRQVVVLAVSLDDSIRTAPRLGPRVWDLVLAQAGDRITSVLRGGDQIVRLDGAAFAVVLPGMRRPGIDDALNIAARIQSAVADPYHVAGARVQVTASVGLCFETNRPDGDAALFLAAAEAALEEARVHGPASVRIFTDEMRARLQDRSELAETVADALANGQIAAWFQPQICSKTGRVTGLEALARWEHPRRGTLMPGDFLDPIAARGLGPQLFEVVLSNACDAMRHWDRQGLCVPRIAVNIDSLTLRDPLLAERIQWGLDSFDLSPERLAIEILEDVVAAPDDHAIVSNLARIARIGCSIELDDFGTGQASLAGIRRFGVRCIKIDRSYVSGADRDPEQRKLAEAILKMARTLEIATLAEGVATEGEVELFSRLGCDQLQGFGIARPMPASAVPGWITQHHARLGLPPSGTAGRHDVAIAAGETA